jgi:hypothetical protein
MWSVGFILFILLSGYSPFGGLVGGICLVKPWSTVLSCADLWFVAPEVLGMGGGLKEYMWSVGMIPFIFLSG